MKNRGIAATLYIHRDGKLLLDGFFNAKLRKHQVTWLPCEIEALGISVAIKHFAPYIIQSAYTNQILTDSRPCVQAYDKLKRGEFSSSSRVAAFLSNVSRFLVHACATSLEFRIYRLISPAETQGNALTRAVKSANSLPRWKTPSCATSPWMMSSKARLDCHLPAEQRGRLPSRIALTSGEPTLTCIKVPVPLRKPPKLSMSSDTSRISSSPPTACSLSETLNCFSPAVNASSYPHHTRRPVDSAPY